MGIPRSKMIFPKMPPFSSWHSPRHKSLTVVHDLLRFRGCKAIFLYLMLFSAIFPLLKIVTLGSILWAQTYSNRPTMEVAFVKHDLRNISAFGEDGMRTDRPELQWEIHCRLEHHAFYSVALACWLWSLPPQRPKYSLGHAWQKLLPWWGWLEQVWAHRIDPKVP